MKLKNFRDIRTHRDDGHNASPDRPLMVYESTKGVNELYVRTLRNILRSDSDLKSIAEAEVDASTIHLGLRDTTQVFRPFESARSIHLKTAQSEIAEFWSADSEGMKRIAFQWADIGFRLFLDANGIDQRLADGIQATIGSSLDTTYIHATKSSPSRKHRAEVLVEWEPRWAKVVVRVVDRANSILATRTLYDGRPHVLGVLWRIPRLTWLDTCTLEIDLHNLANQPPKERMRV